MAGIGMRFAVEPAPERNIEDTLTWAAAEGMSHDDLRVLGVLVTWIEVHGAAVNVDRLTRLAALEPPRMQAFWSAVAAWRAKDRRFARLARVYKGPRVNVLAIGTDFQIRRHGEDPRFVSGPLVVPANLLRARPDDVLTPAELARRHRGYRLRVMMGPS